MGLISSLVLLPLAPIRASIWIAERLAVYAQSELEDEATIRRVLLDAEAALEAGELGEDEFDRIEDELLNRLDEVRAQAQEVV